MNSATFSKRLSKEQADVITRRNELESSLLRLPAELRNIIYELVFTIGCVRMRPYNVAKGVEHAFQSTRSKNLPTLYKLLKLTQICRQVYKESASLPYVLNRFKFHIPVELASDIIDQIPDSVGIVVRELQLFQNDVFLRTSIQFSGAAIAVHDIVKSLKKFPNLEKVELTFEFFPLRGMFELQATILKKRICWNVALFEGIGST